MTDQIACSHGFFKANRYLNKILIGTFFLSVFFPFLKIVSFTDTQPTALILSIVIFVFYTKKYLSKILFVLIVPFFFSQIFVFMDGFSFDAVRNSLSYMSLFFISAATYFILRSRQGFDEWYMKFATSILFLVGFIQTFLKRDFLTFLLPRASASMGRGVVGLGPEPTTYAFMCLFLMYLCVFHRPRHYKLWMALLVVQIIVFAKSSLGVLILTFWLLAYVFFSFSPLKMVASLFAVGSLYSAVLICFQNTRMYALINLTFQNPNLILLDGSIRDRVSHIFFSFLGSYRHGFVPQGFVSYSGYVASEIGQYSQYFFGIHATNKIMSGFGSAFYELGIVGFLIPFVIFYLLRKQYLRDFRGFLLMASVIFFSLVSALPLSFPYIGFLIGYLAYSSQCREASLKPIRLNEAICG